MLSIYVDGELKEDINLFDIATLDDLHSMMVEKGFELMPEEDIAAMKKNKWAEVLSRREKMRIDAIERRAAMAAARAATPEALAVEEASASEL